MSISSKILSIVGVIAIDLFIFKNVFASIYYEYQYVKRTIKRGVFTNGMIVGYQIKKDLDQREQFASIVQFESNGGDLLTINSNDYKFTKSPLGSFVPVCYIVDSPSDAVVDPHSVLKFKVFLMSVIIGVLAAINILIFLKLVK